MAAGLLSSIINNKYIVTGTIGLKKIAVSNLIGLVPITSVFAKGPKTSASGS